MGMIKKQSPHLPEKTCSVHGHHFWQNIRFTIYVAVIALLAGITGALVVSAWLEPDFYSTQKVLLVNRTIDNTTGQISTWSKTPSVLAAKRLEYSTIDIFDKSFQIAKNFYPKEAFLGRVAMLSSSGWGVIYYPEFTQAKLTNWLALDSQGIEYKIENTIFDAERGMLYVKFVGDNFRVMSFPNWNNFTNGTKVWVSDYNVWKERQLGDTIVVVKNPHVITEQYSRLHLEPETSPGDMVMTEDGQFVGFVDKNGMLQTAWFADFQLSNLLEKGEFIKNNIDWSGYFVERHGSSDTVGTPGSGFLITNPGKVVTNLRKGDIIIAINNSSIDPHNLWKTVLTNTGDFNLTVWRNGEEVVLKIKLINN